MKVAFVGLGSMGTPMARNLVKAGFDVAGFDTNPRALAALAANGGKAAKSAAEAAVGAEVLILMVVNASQAEGVLFDEGSLEALPADATVVLMATCPPRSVQKIARAVAKTGRAFVDAPVSGGATGADKGTLSIMAAAPPEVLERVRPVLGALGDRILQVGTEPGQGAAMKAVNQLLCGVHIAAAAEGVSLARKIGVDPKVALEILIGSSASSWMLKDRGPRMLQADPAGASTVDIFVKDLGIVLEAGRESGSALPLAAAAHQMFLAASGRGDGSADDSQVVRSYIRLNEA
jgi:3-hydroxyisobutyrate dehydrogenase